MNDREKRNAALEREYESLCPEDKAKVIQFVKELKANRNKRS